MITSNLSNDLVVLDIGTHKAQELRVLYGDRIYILFSYLWWWFDWGMRIVKRLIRYNGMIQYGSGAYVVSPIKFPFDKHMKYFKQFFLPKNYLNNIKVISIDPMTIVTDKYIKKMQQKVQAHYVPIAILPHDGINKSQMVKFYVAKNSLSSSLYQNKLDDLQEVIVPAFELGELLDGLIDIKVLGKECRFILRMNCEGSELGAINSLISRGSEFRHVLGSIADVGKKHGVEVETEMDDIMDKNRVNFAYYKGSDPSTWHTAFDLFESECSTDTKKNKL
mgnify:FL=1